MVNLLIGNSNRNEVKLLYQELANEENYKIQNSITAQDTISLYWKTNPDILILDSELDMPLKDIVDKLSCTPIERKRCNTVLTVPSNYIVQLNNFKKINTIIYKPILPNELSNTIKEIAIDYNTPDLEVEEIDCILQALNFNYMSAGFMYMKDAITYCYYNREKLEYLKDIIMFIAYKYNVPFSRVRDTLYSSIRPYNNTSLSFAKDLYQVLYNGGDKLSLKDFLDRVVSYIIMKNKKKGRLF